MSKEPSDEIWLLEFNSKISTFKPERLEDFTSEEVDSIIMLAAEINRRWYDFSVVMWQKIAPETQQDANKIIILIFDMAVYLLTSKWPKELVEYGEPEDEVDRRRRLRWEDGPDLVSVRLPPRLNDGHGGEWVYCDARR